MLSSVQKRDSFDVMSAVFALTAASRPKMPAATPIIHTALFELASQDPYRDLLEDYVFERRSYYPFSRDFQIDLTNMELSGLLATPNPDYQDFSFEAKLQKCLEGVSEEDRKLLQRMARDFDAALERASRSVTVL